jgi:mono/diheme cytochrome c family protein
MARGSLLPLAFCIVLASGCESPRTRVGSKPTAADLIARGQYLANGIARCFLCHAPLDDGDPALPRPETLGAGDVLDEKAPLIAPNITFERETGLGDWSDREIIRAIREGIGRDGRELQEHPANHYSVMTDEDVSAVIAYLRSLRPIRRKLPRSAPPLQKGEWVQRKTVPALSSALNSPRQRGAYLVQLGECIGCHTPARGDGSAIRELEFAGGRRFRLEKGYGVDIGRFDPMLSSVEAPLPMTGRVVASANITPDPSGIPYYTEAIFIQTIRTGKVSGVRQLSAAMPWVFFRTLSDPDLRDIFAYLKTLRATQHNVDNTDEPTFCPRCGHWHGLGELNVPLRMERR